MNKILPYKKKELLLRLQYAWSYIILCASNNKGCS